MRTRTGQALRVVSRATPPTCWAGVHYIILHISTISNIISDACVRASWVARMQTVKEKSYKCVMIQYLIIMHDCYTEPGDRE